MVLNLLVIGGIKDGAWPVIGLSFWTFYCRGYHKTPVMSQKPPFKVGESLANGDRALFGLH